MATFRNLLASALLVLLSVVLGAEFALPTPAVAQATDAAADTEAGAETAAGAETDAGEAPIFPVELADPEISEQALTFLLVPLTQDELQALAETWLGIVKEKTREVAETQVALVNAEGVQEEGLRAGLAETIEERKDLFERFTKIVDALEKKAGDEAVVAALRAYRSSVIIEEKRTADFQTLFAEAVGWLTAPDGGVELAKDLAIVIAALVGLLFVAGVIRGFAGRGIRHIPNISTLLQAFLITMVYWVVVAVGLMVVLSALGVDISPVFALIGGASFILAFAFQDTLGNLASGLMIMVNRPFDEGDYVDVGGTAGTVKGVSIVATTVMTPDNQRIVIPNKNVWGNVITNVTASPTRRVDLVFGISYDDSIAEAIEVMERTVTAHPLVLPDPAPVIQVGELADSSVNFVCRPWTKTGDYWTVYWDLTRQIKEAFDAAGLSIPYPQRDVHVRAPADVGSASEDQALSLAR